MDKRLVGVRASRLAGADKETQRVGVTSQKGLIATSPETFQNDTIDNSPLVLFSGQFLWTA
jgi:hypothetical protein